MSTKPDTAYVCSATNQSGRKLHYRDDCQAFNQGATARATDPDVHPGRDWCRLCDPETHEPAHPSDYGTCPLCGEALTRALGSHIRHDH